MVYLSSGPLMCGMRLALRRAALSSSSLTALPSAFPLQFMRSRFVTLYALARSTALMYSYVLVFMHCLVRRHGSPHYRSLLELALYVPLRSSFLILALRTMSVLPQSRPAGAYPSGRIPTVDHSGRGVSLAALAGTPDNVLRGKFPSLAQALDHFAKVGNSKFSFRITVSSLLQLGYTHG